MDIFSAYKKLFATTTNEPVCWWYCGTVFTDVEGLGAVPMNQAETIMVFKTETPSPDVLKIRWLEVGYFRDITTGEVVKSWHNPFTGKDEARTQRFEDGPAEYTVTKKGDDVEISLIQHHARIEAVKLTTSVADGQISFIQAEDKTRTYPRPDGTWPDLDSAEASNIRTTLSIYGNLAEAENPAVTNVRSSGFYTSGSLKQDGVGAWGKSMVRGVMQKAGVDEQLNPIAWQRLKTLFPEFFKGERVNPNW